MNKVVLIGRLTRDPELRYTGNNTPVASFSLAVNRNYSNQQGEREADFINIVVWRKQAENVKNYLTQGSQVAIDGRLQTRTYDDQNGQRRYITEVIADNVTFLSSRAGGSQIPESSSNTSSYTANNAVPNNGMANNDIVTADLDMDPYAAMGNEVSLTDDDLPF